MRIFKRYFITGLLIWIPLVITIWVIALLINTLESVVPSFLTSQSLFGYRIPGFQLLLVVLIVFLSGLFGANFIGRAFVERWEQLLGRIPLVRSIYNSVKQVSDTVLSPNGQAFREAVLVQYPRHGSWTIAFLTGAPTGEVAAKLAGDYVSVYVPTTPNPTSGFFLMMPREDIQVLDITVDAALKYIVSMGVVAPAVSKEFADEAEAANVLAAVQDQIAQELDVTAHHAGTRPDAASPSAVNTGKSSDEDSSPDQDKT
ncbi:MAG TPA: DUF502 domain-containing protein [Eoetvoesiella sp.]